MVAGPEGVAVMVATVAVADPVSVWESVAGLVHRVHPPGVVAFCDEGLDLVMAARLLQLEGSNRYA